MLVIISDLHFTDGTTSNNGEGERDITNVNHKAFRRFLEKVSEIVKHRKAITKVSFVYNGDIFDPLRSSDWFDASSEESPWQEPYNDSKMLAKCRAVLVKIISHPNNAEALEWLSGQHPKFAEVWQNDAQIDRIYIPGNHDRVVNMDDAMRRKIYEVLLKKTGKKKFKNFILDDDHKTLVMHGHEADPFNCEFDRNGNPLYKEQPIGDSMTTMLFTAIGHKAQKLSIPVAAKRRLRDVEHVRPHLMAISYLQDILKDFPQPRIKNQISKMIQGIVDQFQDLDYYKEWIKKHDQWNIRLDEADKLQTALRAVKLFGTHVPVGLLEKISSFISDTTSSEFAVKQLKSLIGQSVRFCVLGHTHEPKHVPLFVDEDGNEKHYLNSGTFRLNLGRTFDLESFLRFQRMSFVIIYGPNEFNPRIEEPVYELWSGLRMFT